MSGQQRGGAVADFNQDGRSDIAVAQWNGPTQLFVNQSPKRGFRVRLAGSAANPDAIGATLQLVYNDGDDVARGPVRVIQSGSGYTSQSSPVQVLGANAPPQAIEIKWPNGQTQRMPHSGNLWDVQITAED